MSNIRPGSVIILFPQIRRDPSKSPARSACQRIRRIQAPGTTEKNKKSLESEILPSFATKRCLCFHSHIRSDLLSIHTHIPRPSSLPWALKNTPRIVLCEKLLNFGAPVPEKDPENSARRRYSVYFLSILMSGKKNSLSLPFFFEHSVIEKIMTVEAYHFFFSSWLLIYYFLTC